MLLFACSPKPGINTGTGEAGGGSRAPVRAYSGLLSMGFLLAPRGQGLSQRPHSGLLGLGAPQPASWQAAPGRPSLSAPQKGPSRRGGRAGPGRAGSAVRVKAARGGRRAAGGPARGGGRRARRSGGCRWVSFGGAAGTGQGPRAPAAWGGAAAGWLRRRLDRLRDLRTFYFSFIRSEPPRLQLC